MELVEDDLVAVVIVERRKGRRAFQPVVLVNVLERCIVDAVPGDKPSGLIAIDAIGQVPASIVIADRRKSSDQRELAAADG